MQILLILLMGLAMSAQVPAPGSGGGSSGGGGTITAGRVAFGDGTSTAATDSNFVWDNTNKRLGVKSANPAVELSIQGAISNLQTITDTSLIEAAAPASASLLRQADGNADYGLVLPGLGDSAYGLWNFFYKSRSTDGSTHASVQAGDDITNLMFTADNGINYQYVARIGVYVEDSITPNSFVPGRIEFSTASTSSGDNIVLTIKSTGNTVFGSSGDVGLYRTAANVLEVNTGTIGTLAAIKLSRVQLAPMAVAALATCNSGNAGSVSAVNDASAPAWGSTVASGGSAYAQVTCNGTNWTVTGK